MSSCCSMLSNSVLVLSVCFHTHTLSVSDCTDVVLPAACVPESAAKRVMEHALLNDESEYWRDREDFMKYTSVSEPLKL